MLKHPDLTLRRIQLFIRTELKPNFYGERVPLKIEINRDPATTDIAAKAGTWETVEPGFQYGPAYTTFWFRLTGKVPKEWAGLEIAVIPDVGGERTLWDKGTPIRGIDYEHTDFGLLTGGNFPQENLAKGGESVTYIIQSYTTNPQHSVHLKEKPREAFVEKVVSAELAVVNRSMKDLYYDFEFSLDLAKSCADDPPAYETILRTLNECINLFARDGQESIARCRKLIKDALGSLNAEFKHTIYPVGHAHLDTAWLWPIQITKKKMAHTTSTQLSLMERYPKYVFAHSQASQYEWLELEYPTLFKRVKAAVDRGQWEPVGSMWVEADCNLTGAESLVRQFLYGKRYFRDKLGVETSDMWLPDVFGYSAALPQILNKFGIKTFLTQKISWNQFNKFPHHTFWWQGIDGTKVWSHFPPADTYIGNCEPTEVVRSVKNYRDHGRSENSLYLFGFGDGGGGPTERHLEYISRGRLAPNYPEVNFGKKASDFFREARAKSKDLMTWSGELYLELHRGTYTSQANNKKWNRESEFLLRDVELLHAFANTKYPKQEIERLWKLVLLNQFHDIIPGSSVVEVYEDSTRDYEDVLTNGRKLVDQALAAHAKQSKLPEGARAIALFQNSRISGQTLVPWSEEWVPGGVRDGQSWMPIQVVENQNGKHLLFETPESSLGTVSVCELTPNSPNVKQRLKVSSRRLENAHWSVRFDLNGNISSIQSMEDGSEYVQPGKLANVFQLFEDKPLFWSAWDIDVYAYETAQDLLRCESFEVVERGPVRAAVEIVRKFSKSTIRQRISLGPTSGIRFDTEIDWHEEDKLLKVAFPVNVNATAARYEIQFGNVQRPTHMNTSWDMAQFEVCAQKWVDVSEGEMGMALLNDGKYGFDCQGSTLRMTLLRAPKAPDPNCDMGKHTFSYVLMPHTLPYQYADIVNGAYSLNAPVRHLLVDAAVGEPIEPQPFVSTDELNLVIESVKRAEDSDDLIVRLYECHNSRGQAEVYFGQALESAVLCDLEENEVGELEVSENSVMIGYRPFEIITLKVKLNG